MDCMETTFKERVLAIVKTIPKGQTLSYGEVARRAGNEKASRAVGRILTKYYNQEIPCHRVVKSNGDVGGYNRGRENKIKMLLQEGA